MPEWPEMETYRRLLSPLVCGQTIVNVDVNREKTINEPEETFRGALTGRKIMFVERRAKYLLFHLDDGNRLLLHLMLGGYLVYGTEAEKDDSRFQVVFALEDGNRLFFGGLRLGFLHRITAKAAIEQFRELGPEPFDPRLTEEAFVLKLAKKRGKLKPALVDQKWLAGIGNCYSDEICFEAGVVPFADIASLTDDTKRNVYHAMRKVLTEAAEEGGYMDKKLTANDTLTGGYDDKCKVYDREGEPCPRCGGTIQLATISSRKMFYCPSCQGTH
ncbi:MULTISPECIES: bifunctional DNA-formamidopyrimidine glycosylase/DNA-(apurinic or apyrimidinic site) lyase [Cohnella]|uniref:bifunctional DNA-formamidopyrimidine glycosylase/DNA-(apurinic or apyrimidinic site) lyase n=1 Tax=Cohnella TaxID=329857 RepID=UPI0009BA26FB|nr:MULTISPECIES: bifunctional DNA-formamidopyrimidine glycosylase/DNA-(apurinic or apyrimidinic site) lyase [Cohnella]MBN2983906.1 bifunctional DNA-formamidopyrimidine glycosylase/DNA-(apurinic or apyrimidinic site) lyase [Cohnella algarum]